MHTPFICGGQHTAALLSPPGSNADLTSGTLSSRIASENSEALLFSYLEGVALPGHESILLSRRKRRNG